MKRNLVAAVLSLFLLSGCGIRDDAKINHDLWQDEPSMKRPSPEMQIWDIDELLRRPVSPYAAHVYSHQGTGREETSETFAAYDLAIAYGSRFLEQDLCLSSDGVLYCCHDDTPKAVSGVDRSFSEMTAAEIDALRTKDGQSILRLRDVFGRYGRNVTYVVEVRPGTLAPFLDLVRELELQDRVIMQSAVLDDLKEADRVFPDMKKLFLVFSANRERYEQAIAADCVDIICVSGDYFDQENCDRVHAAGKEFSVAVLNRADWIKRAIEMGVDSYFTDYTAKAFAIEEAYRK